LAKQRPFADVWDQRSVAVKPLRVTEDLPPRQSLFLRSEYTEPLRAGKQSAKNLVLLEFVNY
jgi:hypothetical protein